jgi:D-lactate dehydrogenase (cytochrome)
VPEYVNTTIAAYKIQCPDIRKISTDAALPAEAFNGIIDKWIYRLESSRLHYAIFGHVGDYHLHVNILPRDAHELSVAEMLYKTMMTEAIDCGGTVSAEHGIGKLKVSYLSQMYGEKAMAEMRAIKSSVDKKWLLNKGNVFEI